MTQQFDLGIIGGGPAGYTAAFQARSKGLSVVLFEKDKVGGVCLNRGCIPTKAVLHSAELYEEMKSATELGITAENLSFDYSKVVERKDKIVEKLRKSLELSLKNSGVVVVNAEAKIPSHTMKDGENQVFANGEIYECKKIITATGSKPRDFDGLRFDHKFILSSDDILNLKTLPKSIVIIGSGAIGIEWARILSAFDVEVTIVEMADHLLPLADIEVSKRVERIFKSKKIKFYTSNGVEKIENQNVTLKSGETLTPELVLLATGRTPQPIENCDICIGDACGKIQLAHFAIKQAVAEIANIEFNENLVPSVVYGCPEIAWIGKREQDLEEGNYKKSNILISALGKSHCDNCSDGFIKILSQEGKIVGAHIVSKEAASLIQEITIAMQNNIAIDDLKKVCFAHPTYSEGIFECLFK
ncbi:dihydrolipoyl dehydrogenase [Clostridium sp. CAG:715]|nr:dihydrolipoyl dehydrogenase [Clostridium sp. CAG:715]